LQQHRRSPADRPAGLHRADGPAAVLRPDGFAHQHRARRPLAAEAEAEQGAQDHQLREVLCESAQQREERKPDDSELERTHPPDAVREVARDPAAEG